MYKNKLESYDGDKAKNGLSSLRLGGINEENHCIMLIGDIIESIE